MAKLLAKLISMLTPKRRWAQFSLATLFVVVTVFCVGLAVQVNRAHSQRQSVMAESAVRSVEDNINAGRVADNGRLELNRLKARLHYYQACNAEEKRIEELREAAQHDSTDVEVLIALYRLPNLEAELRKQTMEWIGTAAAEFRRRIQNDPDEETHYNQLAWLIANTEGDFQEALRASRKAALELRPNDPGLLDTLGRCYFALGDLKNAVKYQSKAVLLNPHSGLMNKQLVLFQEALAKEKAEGK